MTLHECLARGAVCGATMRHAGAFSFRIELISVLLICSLALPTFAVAGSRPKIGIALSGGAARGLCHIGVLQWLEENQIPIDAIGGTSAGGLIGGLYATGFSPTELRVLVREVNWDRLVGGDQDFTGLTVQQKSDQRSYPVKLQFRNGTLPRGLNDGHQIELLLKKLCKPFNQIQSFDDLPTPFRCVSTEMIHGTETVLSTGPLERALRATTAIPGYIDPVVIDKETVLADGVLVNNLPTDVVRSMGTDVVIGVDVTFPVTDHEAWKSVFGNLNQSACIMAEQLMKRQRTLADVLIDVDAAVPEFNRFRGTDYSQNEAIIDCGYRAAAALGEQLKRYAIDDVSWRAYCEQREMRRKAICDSALMAAAPERFVPVQPNGSEEDRQSTLRFRVGMEGRESDNLQVDMAGLLVLPYDPRRGASYRIGAGIGRHSQLVGELLQTYGQSRWFTSNRVSYDSGLNDLYTDGRRMASYDIATARFCSDLGWTDNNYVDFRIGGEWGFMRQSIRTGSDTLEPPDGQIRAVRARLTYDSQDEPSLPTKGSRVVLEGSWFLAVPGASSPVETVELRGSTYHPVGAKDSLCVSYNGGATLSRESPLATEFTLGGPLWLGAYPQDLYRGSGYHYLSAGLIHRLSLTPGLLGVRMYAGLWIEHGAIYEGGHPLASRGCLSGGLLADTFLGPVTLAASVADKGQLRFYAALGRGL